MTYIGELITAIRKSIAVAFNANEVLGKACQHCGSTTQECLWNFHDDYDAPCGCVPGDKG